MRGEAEIAHLLLVTVGQTPRVDLTSLFDSADVQVTLLGALDGLSDQEIQRLSPATDGYPVRCRITDGSTVLVERSRLARHLQRCIDSVDPDAISAGAVLCTADFPELRAEFPLLIPGTALPPLVASVTPHRNIGVVTSNPGQVEAAQRKWREAGFDPIAVADDPRAGRGFREVAAELSGAGCALVVLDCFAHDDETRHLMAEILDVPILLARTMTAAIAADFARTR